MHINNQTRAVVVGGKRTPFVKSFQQFANVRNKELMSVALNALVTDFGLKGKVLGEVALGTLFPSVAQWNFAREAVLCSSLDKRTPAFTIQRACSTSLDAFVKICLKISAGQIETGIAGGSDSNSDLPMAFSDSFVKKAVRLRKAKSFGDLLNGLFSMKFKDLKPVYPGIVEQRTGLSMGEHTELMVKEWMITRSEQDTLALESHIKAVAGYKSGFYDDLITELSGIRNDTLVRSDTSMRKLSALKPAFDFSGAGTLTAGNSTALTDGASTVFVTSENYALSNGLTPLARFKDAETSAVDYVNGEGLLMAPARAVAKILQRNNLTLQDFDFYEIHEAFAGQVLCTLKAWESESYCKDVLGLPHALGSIDRVKVNVMGGSIALGHPFSATGARIVTSLAKLLFQRGSGRGLISVCTAGGMGVVVILEK